jgi:tetratricopeptide (TPR) repeat protein
VPAGATVLGDVARALGGEFDRAALEDLVGEAYTTGRIDATARWSALGVIAAHPRIADWCEALKCAALQEQAALEAGGADLSSALASVDRHRGVVACLMGRSEVALEYFTAALERERNAENLANAMAALVRLGDVEEARELLDDVRRGFPAAIREGVERAVALDGDLALLR